MPIAYLSYFSPTSKVLLPDDNDLGPESEDNDDDIEVFSSVTIPPIIKTVVRNGRTLVYRIQNPGMDQEIPSEPQSQSVSHCDRTALSYLSNFLQRELSASKKARSLVRRVPMTVHRRLTPPWSLTSCNLRLTTISTSLFSISNFFSFLLLQ